MKHMGVFLAAVVFIVSPFNLKSQEPAPATPPSSAPESNPTAPVPEAKPLTVANPENLVRNGNFERSKQGWETHGKVTTVDGRTALEMDASRREPNNLATTLKIDRDVHVLKISFEVKAESGFATKSSSMGAIRMMIIRPGGGYTFYDMDLKSGTEWQTIRRKYEVREGLRDCTFQIDVRPGKGSLYFTNFVIEGLEN